MTSNGKKKNLFSQGIMGQNGTWVKMAHGDSIFHFPGNQSTSLKLQISSLYRCILSISHCGKEKAPLGSQGRGPLETLSEGELHPLLVSVFFHDCYQLQTGGRSREWTWRVQDHCGNRWKRTPCSEYPPTIPSSFNPFFFR